MEIQLTQKQIEKCKRNKNTTKSQELECSHQWLLFIHYEQVIYSLQEE